MLEEDDLELVLLSGPLGINPQLRDSKHGKYNCILKDFFSLYKRVFLSVEKCQEVETDAYQAYPNYFRG